MALVNKPCIGNCAICDLQLSGEVDMIPCALNQLMIRSSRLEAENKEIKTMLSCIGIQTEKEPNIAYGLSEHDAELKNMTSDPEEVE